MLVVGCVLAIVVMLGLKGGGLTERTRIVMIGAVCRLLYFYNTGGNINNQLTSTKGAMTESKVANTHKKLFVWPVFDLKSSFQNR